MHLLKRCFTLWYFLAALTFSASHRLMKYQTSLQTWTDCSDLNWTSVIPTEIPVHTTHLDLSKNFLSDISTEFLAKLTKLAFLDLSSNDLKTLTVETFKGVHNLQILNISSNQLSGPNAFPIGVFHPLSLSLLELDIRDNKMDTKTGSLKYPDGALSELVAITSLKLDCITGSSLGEGFNKVTNLAKIEFSKGAHDCLEVPEDFFFHLTNSSVKYVDMSDLGISKLKAYFPYLKELTTLILNDNPMFARSGYFSRFMFSLRETKVEHLYLSGIGMTDHTVKYDFVKTITRSIKTLMLERNYIAEVDPEVRFSMNNILRLSLAQNALLSPTKLTAELLQLRSIQYLNLSRPSLHHKTRMKRRSEGHWSVTFQSCLVNPSFACAVKFPTNLTHLDLSHSGFQLPTIPELVMMNDNSLQYVDLSSNAIQMLPKPFYCALHYKPTMTFIDLSMNKIECINSSYFAHCDWSSLKKLNLGQNNLKQSAMVGCDAKDKHFLSFLNFLPNLTELDLSGNELESELRLDIDLFKNQRNITELRLSNTRITNFTVKIEHMTKLHYLDLSSNKLTCLNRQMIDELTSLQKDFTPGLTVNLKNNPLQCSCGCYQFIEWIQYTRVHFKDKKSLSCVLQGKSFALADTEKILHFLDSICFRSHWLHNAVYAQTVVFALISFLTLLRRHKCRIYFLYLQLRIRLVSRLTTEEIRPFHAFISYAEQDREWVKRRLIRNLETRRKLRLLVASRDFEAGKLISANIHSAITTSNKTVFVISKSFLKSSWCLEEFSMALAESRKRRKLIMICVLSPNIKIDEIQYQEIREVLNNVTGRKWPQKDSPKIKFQEFWQKLHTDIGSKQSQGYPIVQLICPNGNAIV